MWMRDLKAGSMLPTRLVVKNSIPYKVSYYLATYLPTYTVILKSAEEHADNRVSSKVCLVPKNLIVNINFTYNV
jgi:hypothetical protein